MPSSVHRRLAAAIGLAALTACMRGGGVGLSAPLPGALFGVPGTTDFVVPERVGKLSREEMERVMPRIRSLRAEPAELQQIVGDTIRLSDQVRVLALDSTGAVLGELPGYDFSFPARSLRLLVDGRIVCVRAGKVPFTARLPESVSEGARKSRAAAVVTINVAPDTR